MKPHQAKVATKTPSARLNRAAPSRRSSAGRSLTSEPIRRTPRAHEVANTQPRAAHHPQQPGLLLFDGGKLAGARGAAGRSGPSAGAGGAVRPRPAEPPDLAVLVPRAVPLGAGVVRVAIPATVPELRRISADFRPFRGVYAARPARRLPRCPRHSGKARFRPRTGPSRSVGSGQGLTPRGPPG